MIKKEIGFDVLKIAETCLGYTSTIKSAIMTLKDGSRMTTTLYVFDTPEGHVLVNLNKTKITLDFESKDEFEKYLSKKFEVFESDKEMWQTFTGMDEETWEEWNK
jgi:hypothetical protein